MDLFEVNPPSPADTSNIPAHDCLPPLGVPASSRSSDPHTWVRASGGVSVYRAATKETGGCKSTVVILDQVTTTLPQIAAADAILPGVSKVDVKVLVPTEDSVPVEQQQQLQKPILRQGQQVASGRIILPRLDAQFNASEPSEGIMGRSQFNVAGSNDLFNVQVSKGVGKPFH